MRLSVKELDTICLAMNCWHEFYSDHMSTKAEGFFDKLQDRIRDESDRLGK